MPKRIVVDSDEDALKDNGSKAAAVLRRSERSKTVVKAQAKGASNSKNASKDNESGQVDGPSVESGRVTRSQNKTGGQKVTEKPGNAKETRVVVEVAMRPPTQASSSGAKFGPPKTKVSTTASSNAKAFVKPSATEASTAAERPNGVAPSQGSLPQKPAASATKAVPSASSSNRPHPNTQLGASSDAQNQQASVVQKASAPKVTSLDRKREEVAARLARNRASAAAANTHHDPTLIAAIVDKLKQNSGEDIPVAQPGASSNAQNQQASVVQKASAPKVTYLDRKREEAAARLARNRASAAAADTRHDPALIAALVDRFEQNAGEDIRAMDARRSGADEELSDDELGGYGEPSDNDVFMTRSGAQRPAGYSLRPVDPRDQSDNACHSSPTVNHTLTKNARRQVQRVPEEIDPEDEDRRVVANDQEDQGDVEGYYQHEGVPEGGMYSAFYEDNGDAMEEEGDAMEEEVPAMEEEEPAMDEEDESMQQGYRREEQEQRDDDEQEQRDDDEQDDGDEGKFQYALPGGFFETGAPIPGDRDNTQRILFRPKLDPKWKTLPTGLIPPFDYEEYMVRSVEQHDPPSSDTGSVYAPAGSHDSDEEDMGSSGPAQEDTGLQDAPSSPPRIPATVKGKGKSVRFEDDNSHKEGEGGLSSSVVRKGGRPSNAAVDEILAIGEKARADIIAVAERRSLRASGCWTRAGFGKAFSTKSAKSRKHRWHRYSGWWKVAHPRQKGQNHKDWSDEGLFRYKEATKGMTDEEKDEWVDSLEYPEGFTPADDDDESGEIVDASPAERLKEVREDLLTVCKLYSLDRDIHVVTLPIYSGTDPVARAAEIVVTDDPLIQYMFDTRKADLNFVVGKVNDAVRGARALYEIKNGNLDDADVDYKLASYFNDQESKNKGQTLLSLAGVKRGDDFELDEVYKRLEKQLPGSDVNRLVPAALLVALNALAPANEGLRGSFPFKEFWSAAVRFKVTLVGLPSEFAPIPGPAYTKCRIGVMKLCAANIASKKMKLVKWTGDQQRHLYASDKFNGIPLIINDQNAVVVKAGDLLDHRKPPRAKPGTYVPPKAALPSTSARSPPRASNWDAPERREPASPIPMPTGDPPSSPPNMDGISGYYKDHLQMSYTAAELNPSSFTKRRMPTDWDPNVFDTWDNLDFPEQFSMDPETDVDWDADADAGARYQPAGPPMQAATRAPRDYIQPQMSFVNIPHRGEFAAQAYEALEVENNRRRRPLPAASTSFYSGSSAAPSRQLESNHSNPSAMPRSLSSTVPQPQTMPPRVQQAKSIAPGQALPMSLSPRRVAAPTSSQHRLASHSQKRTRPLPQRATSHSATRSPTHMMVPQRGASTSVAGDRRIVPPTMPQPPSARMDGVMSYSTSSASSSRRPEWQALSASATRVVPVHPIHAAMARSASTSGAGPSAGGGLVMRDRVVGHRRATTQLSAPSHRSEQRSNPTTVSDGRTVKKQRVDQR